MNLDKVSQIEMDSMDIIGRAVGLPIQDMIVLAEGARELRRTRKTPKINTSKWRHLIKPESTQSIGKSNGIG